MKTLSKLITIISLVIWSMHSVAQVATAPYHCDFENAYERTQWMLLNGQQTNQWVVGTATNNGGSYALYISNDGGTSHAYTNTVASTVWVCRQIALTPGLYDISFDWHSQGYSTSHYMRAYLIPTSSFNGSAGSSVGFMTTGHPTNWIPIDNSYPNGALMNQQSNWTNTYITNVSVPTLTTYYIAFGWTNTSYNTSGLQPPAAIDNIQIVAATCPRPTNLSVSSNTIAGNATVTWVENGSANEWILEYSTSSSFNNARRVYINSNNSTINGRNITYSNLTNLQPFTSYYMRVRALCSPQDSSMTSPVYVYRFCPSSIGCIDFTNLRGPGVVCTYGKYQYYGQYSANYGGPYADTGVVDLGPGSYGRSSANPGSRHTINRDPNAHDPLCPQIMRIPPNECQSVRLGSYYGGYICQSISYDMLVDTATADILLFKYACVFNDVNHNATQQPRFILEILDSAGRLINPTCGAANYSATDVSSGSVGGTWYTVTGSITLNDTIVDSVTGAVNCTTMTYSSHTIRARDWTPLGLNISPYHGQTITIRITSFSCGQSGPNHCGYVYFTLGCSKARITSTTCGGGTTNTTLTAPSGFTYRWYTALNPNRTISTQQTINVQLDSTMYYCDVRFIDDTDCFFTISTLATLRYPKAAFTGTMTSDSCKYKLSLHNTSYVTADPSDTNRTGLCESFFWDFGNGQTSTVENPTVTYTQPGTYVVRLISSINNGECSDTIEHRFTFNRRPSGHIIAPRRICKGDSVMLRPYNRGYVEYTWNNGYNGDTLYDMPDTTTRYSLITIDSIGCIDTMYATVNVSNCVIYDTTCRNEAYISYGFIIPHDTIYRYHDTICMFQKRVRSSFNLDSTTTLFLTILDTNEVLICDTFCSGDNYMFYDVPIISGGYYSKRFTNAHGCDSIIYLDLVEIERPTLRLSHSFVPCFDYPITLSAYNTGEWIRWYSSPTDTSLMEYETQDTLTVTPSERTTYTAISGYNDYSCITTTSIIVNIETNLSAHIHSSSRAADYNNMQIVFRDCSVDNDGRRWYLNDFNLPVGEDENYIYTFSADQDSVTIYLVAFINNTKCSDTVDVTIPLFKEALWIPNIFTPGEDINNTFCVSGIDIISYNIKIYDRHGILVYESRDIDEGWNGRLHNTGEQCKTESYVYRVDYVVRSQPDRIFSRTGSVLLVR